VASSASADGGSTQPKRYVDQLPAGLRRALAAGRWLPIIGAGMSANASTPDGRSPPLWRTLGEELAKELGIPGANPIDVLSAYADLYERPYLVERLTELLLVNELEIGELHRSFAQLPFETVVTTNIDTLLEEAYQAERRPSVPLIGESQLSIQRRRGATHLLKFHGDLNHPDHLVVTEEDYDGFLQRRPLLATYLSSWILTREPVLIGYSLDDADLREILVLLRERLGRMTRAVWAILATDPDNEARKFERRGIKPIVLNRDPNANRAMVFTDFFKQLRTQWESDIAPQLRARGDATTAELCRRPGIAPQLALFVANRSTLALYQDFVFSAVPQTGLMPLGVDEVEARDSAMTPMAIDMALSRAAVVVYDISRGNPLPLGYVVSRREVSRSNSKSLFVVSGEGERDPATIIPAETTRLSRPADMMDWPETLALELVKEMRENVPSLSPETLATKLDELHELPPDERSAELLYTSLALLEAELRLDESSRLPTSLAPGGGQTGRLREFFQDDYPKIAAGVRLRHSLLQGVEDKQSDDVKAQAMTLETIVRKRRSLLPSGSAPSSSSLPPSRPGTGRGRKRPQPSG
jgi:hypothetical protein